MVTFCRQATEPCGRIHQRADLVAHLRRQHPPFFLPGAHAARAPQFGVVVQRIFHASRHRAQRVADQVGGAVEDGELGRKRRSSSAMAGILDHSANFAFEAEACRTASSSKITTIPGEEFPHAQSDFLFVASPALISLLSLSAQQLRGDYIESRSTDVYVAQCFANGEVGLTGNSL